MIKTSWESFTSMGDSSEIVQIQYFDSQNVFSSNLNTIGLKFLPIMVGYTGLREDSSNIPEI